MDFLLIILALFFIFGCQENWIVIFYVYVHCLGLNTCMPDGWKFLSGLILVLVLFLNSRSVISYNVSPWSCLGWANRYGKNHTYLAEWRWAYTSVWNFLKWVSRMKIFVRIWWLPEVLFYWWLHTKFFTWRFFLILYWGFYFLCFGGGFLAWLIQVIPESQQPRFEFESMHMWIDK